MTVSPFEVYMIMQLDSLISLFKGFAWAAGILGVMFFAFGLICWASSIEEEDQGIILGRKCFKFTTWVCVPALLFCMVTSTLLPNTKTIAAMYLVPTVINNEQVQKLPEDLLKLFRGLIKDWTPKIEEKEGGSNDHPKPLSL